MEESLVFEKFFVLPDSLVMDGISKIFKKKIRDEYHVVDAVRGKNGKWIIHLSRKMIT